MGDKRILFSHDYHYIIVEYIFYFEFAICRRYITLFIATPLPLPVVCQHQHPCQRLKARLDRGQAIFSVGIMVSRFRFGITVSGVGLSAPRLVISNVLGVYGYLAAEPHSRTFHTASQKCVVVTRRARI